MKGKKTGPARPAKDDPFGKEVKSMATNNTKTNIGAFEQKLQQMEAGVE